MDNTTLSLEKLAFKRLKTSFIYSALLFVMYASFLMIVVYKKEWIGVEISPNFTVGFLLFFSVIIGAFALTGFYVVWANKIYDVHVNKLIKEEKNGR